MALCTSNIKLIQSELLSEVAPSSCQASVTITACQVGNWVFVILPSIFVHQHVRECTGMSTDRRGSERKNRPENAAMLVKCYNVCDTV